MQWEKYPQPYKIISVLLPFSLLSPHRSFLSLSFTHSFSSHVFTITFKRREPNFFFFFCINLNTHTHTRIVQPACPRGSDVSRIPDAQLERTSLKKCDRSIIFSDSAHDCWLHVQNNQRWCNCIQTAPSVALQQAKTWSVLVRRHPAHPEIQTLNK